MASTDINVYILLNSTSLSLSEEGEGAETAALDAWGSGRREPCMKALLYFLGWEKIACFSCGLRSQVRGRGMMQGDEQNCSEGT